MYKPAIALAVFLAATASAQANELADVDKDGNGTISQEEFLSVYGPEMGVEQFRIIDADHNDQIDLAEYEAQTNDAGLLGE